MLTMESFCQFGEDVKSAPALVLEKAFVKLSDGRVSTLNLRASAAPLPVVAQTRSKRASAWLTVPVQILSVIAAIVVFAVALALIPFLVIAAVGEDIIRRVRGASW